RRRDAGAHAPQPRAVRHLRGGAAPLLRLPARSRGLTMRMHPALLLALVTAVAAADGVATTQRQLPDGSRVLRQSIEVDAPLETVWEVFTTAEGWESWAVPFARVDLRVGGIIEPSYDPGANPGDRANIRSRILSFLPYRMLSIQAVQAPPGFEYADLLPSLHSVIE